MNIKHIESNEIQVVVINSVFETIEDSFVKEFYPKFLEMKKLGYHSSHSSSYLPLGADDFICTYLAICENVNGHMIPISVAKVVPYGMCLKYNIPFPLLDILGDCYNDLEMNAIKNIVESRIQKGHEITYSGGWTMNPAYKGRNELNDLLKEVYTGIHYNLHIEHNFSAMIGFGCPKFKTDLFFKAWGINPVMINDNEVRSVFAPKLNNVEIITMFNDVSNLSKWKVGMGKKYQDLWNNRIEVSKEDNLRKRVA